MEAKENKEWDLVRYAGDEPIKWSFTEIEILLTVVRLMQGSSSNKQQLKLGFDTLKNSMRNNEKLNISERSTRVLMIK